MADYIEKETAKEAILSWAVCINHPELLSKEDAMHCIDNLPAADVAPVRHGRWEIKVFAFSHCKKIRCSICGYSENRGPAWDEGYGLANYCPNCGAHMDMEDAG